MASGRLAVPVIRAGADGFHQSRPACTGAAGYRPRGTTGFVEPVSTLVVT